jgi:type I restriction-modification system DNA methylase subunit
MNLTQIENNVQALVKNFHKESFIYDLLLAYDHPRASISRLKNGGLNLSKIDGEIAWKKKLYFKVDYENDLHELIDDLKDDNNVTKYAPRFIIATDYDTLLAIDTKTEDTLDTPILDLAKHFDFFLPWAGMEKAQLQSENPADVKAAERMAKLYDEIKKDNPTKTKEEVHNLNVFLSRLLFCFFAEDTGIFEAGQFTNSISSHTQQDGSDLNAYLDKLFEVMNTEQTNRHNLPAYLDSFPYVNGGLFRDIRNAPAFTRKSRQALIESGELDWSAINPDIFGSMIQAVISPEHRGSLGMHYTSVPNIMKVIEPLFLDELKDAFEAARGNKKLLNQLLHRISNIKIFDPACGSGNFLIIAYKQLRRLEMEIFKETSSIAFSGIRLSNFYGIEIDDFAHEIAILSLWLAEHQMNKEFFNAFGRTKPPLPLVETGNIVHGNATRLDWENVCPKQVGDEIYILGNPPYLGARNQNDDQKKDMFSALGKIDGINNLDYISCWFIKGAHFIKESPCILAFVTTNSICQGAQVPLLWKTIFDQNIEIEFAYEAFKWSNNAKDNAGVVVTILGLGRISKKVKKVFKSNFVQNTDSISPYLVSGNKTIIESRLIPLSNIPKMVFGSMPNDEGNLILENTEKDLMVSTYPDSIKYLKKFIGSSEFIRGNERWCIWLNQNNFPDASLIPLIKSRVKKVEEVRIASKRLATNKLSEVPYRFAEIRHLDTQSIIVPSVSSEKREYIPIGFLDENTVISNLALAIYDANPWVFSMIMSKMHMKWVHSIGGYLGTSIRYSISVCYNTFPFPSISENQKQELESCVYRILEEREHYSEKTLAQLYDPDKMPDGLREAHRLNDLAVERCYRSKPFESDEERLEYLFFLYEKMKNDDDNNGTLFAKTVKPKKK